MRVGTKEELDIATGHLEHLKAQLHTTEQQRDALAAMLLKCLQCIETDGGAFGDDTHPVINHHAKVAAKARALLTYIEKRVRLEVVSDGIRWGPH
jgi:hypothetical protein